MNRRCTKSGACLDRWSLGMATRRLRLGPRLLGGATALSFPLGAGRVVTATVGAGVMVVGIDASRREECWVTRIVARGQPPSALAGWPRATLMSR